MEPTRALPPCQGTAPLQQFTFDATSGHIIYNNKHYEIKLIDVKTKKEITGLTPELMRVITIKACKILNRESSNLGPDINGCVIDRNGLRPSQEAPARPFTNAINTYKVNRLIEIIAKREHIKKPKPSTSSQMAPPPSPHMASPPSSQIAPPPSSQMAPYQPPGTTTPAQSPRVEELSEDEEEGVDGEDLPPPLIPAESESENDSSSAGSADDEPADVVSAASSALPSPRSPTSSSAAPPEVRDASRVDIQARASEAAPRIVFVEVPDDDKPASPGFWWRVKHSLKQSLGIPSPLPEGIRMEQDDDDDEEDTHLNWH